MKMPATLLREMVAALPDPVFLLSESGRYISFVGGGDASYYHDGNMLVGHTLHEVLPREKADWFLAQIRRALKEQRLITVEYGLAGKDVKGVDSDTGPSGELWFEGRIQPLSSPFQNERAVVWVARNITRRHRLEENLRRMSETDALTGAFNRRKFFNVLDDRFAEFRRYEHPTALIMIDIDHFKEINDSFGHSVGDDVLRRVVTVCSGQLRSLDMLFRYGGEEFCVLLPNTPIPSACTTAERLRELVTQRIVCQPGLFRQVSISVGVSGLHAADGSGADMVKRADDALYEAKRAGRNRVACIPDPDA